MRTNDKDDDENQPFYLLFIGKRVVGKRGYTHHDQVKGDRVYHQQRVARSWAESQEECQAGGGHLTRLLKVVLVEILKSIVASLTKREEEEQVLDSVPATDVWTGGNLCSDSPAPLHSMWTDGSENEETHFAR